MLNSLFFAKHTIVFLIFPGLIETLPAFVGMFFFKKAPLKKQGASELWCLFMMTNRFLF